MSTYKSQVQDVEKVSMINKYELSEELAKKLEIDVKEVLKFLDTLTEQIQEYMIKGEVVGIKNFGRFFLRPEDPWEFKNPSTEELVNLPARLKPSFRYSSKIKQVARSLPLSIIQNKESETRHV